MPTNKKEYYHSRPPEVKERILAQMRATRIRLYKAKCEAEGKEYIPKPIRTENNRLRKEAIKNKAPRVPKVKASKKQQPGRAKPLKKEKPAKIQPAPLPTIHRDLSTMVPVHVDHKTTVYVRPGVDTGKILAKYLNR